MLAASMHRRWVTSVAAVAALSSAFRAAASRPARASQRA